MRSIVHAVRLHRQCRQIKSEAALDQIAGAGYDLTPCGPPLRHLAALSEKLGEVCAAGSRW